MVDHKTHDDTKSNVPIYHFYNEVGESENVSANRTLVASFSNVATVVRLRLDWPVAEMTNTY